MENIPVVIEPEHTQDRVLSEKPVERESIFDVIIINGIIDAFTDDLAEAGFSREQIVEFERRLESLDEGSVKSLLSMPKELRTKNFPKFFQSVDSGQKSIPEIVLEIVNSSTRNGYTLGYHVSSADILQKGDEWFVEGRELDDRDDKNMAYYSLDYRNIFKSNRSKYLYVIRANIGPNSDHKRDTSNNWGRAPTLAIVCKFNMTEVNEKVEQIYKENNDKNAG
jgi:hypothetical protein